MQHQQHPRHPQWWRHAWTLAFVGLKCCFHLHWAVWFCFRANEVDGFCLLVHLKRIWGSLCWSDSSTHIVWIRNRHRGEKCFILCSVGKHKSHIWEWFSVIIWGIKVHPTFDMDPSHAAKWSRPGDIWCGDGGVLVALCVECPATRQNVNYTVDNLMKVADPTAPRHALPLFLTLPLFTSTAFPEQRKL